MHIPSPMALRLSDLSDRGQNMAVVALLTLLRALPYRWRVPLGGWAMRALVAPFAGYDKRVRTHLALVWPDLPAARVTAITRAVCDNAGRTLAELYSPAKFKALVANAPILGSGMGPILEAQASGRAVIFVSGHFGNHDIARAVLAGRGKPVAALYRPQENPYFDRHFSATIRAISAPLFARGRRGLVELVTHLKSGGMLGMLIDQHFHTGAVLDFMGRKARTSLSAAELALKYNCLLVPVYGIRQADGLHFDLLIEAPIPHTDPVTMTQALNDSLAAQVRARPEQWFWVHRRWRKIT